MANLLTKRREPFAFLLTVGIVGMALLFLGMSFIYVIRKSGSDWATFRLPGIFWFSTAAIVASSFTLSQANAAFRKEKFVAYKWLTGITLSLGVLFIISQFIGWRQLFVAGVALNKSASGAFLYVLSGLHILHIVGGIIVLAMAFTNALKHSTYVDSFVYSVNPPTQLKLKLVTIYWHFVDVLWIYLFLFFLYHHSR